MVNAQHSAVTVEHYTPPRVVEAAREVMGGIDLDPATTLSVNERVVRAKRFYTKEDNGLLKEWSGKVFLNPPGGRVGNRSSAAVWWNMLCHCHRSGAVEQAVFIGFSIEILATTQDSLFWPGHFPFCIPKRRIRFIVIEDGDYVEGAHPTHSNIIVYLPPMNLEGPRNGPRNKFAHHFGCYGKVRL